MTTTRLIYTYYDLTIRKARNSKWENSSSKLYTTSNHSLKSGRVLTTAIGNVRLSRVSSVLDTLD